MLCVSVSDDLQDPVLRLCLTGVECTPSNLRQGVLYFSFLSTKNLKRCFSVALESFFFSFFLKTVFSKEHLKDVRHFFSGCVLIRSCFQFKLLFDFTSTECIES